MFSLSSFQRVGVGRVRPIFLASLAVFLATENSVHAQAGAYLHQTTDRLNQLISAEGRGYKFPTDTFSIGGALLNKSAQWKTIVDMTMLANQEYKLLAAGDDDALDVDIRIVDDKGNELKKDDGVAKTAQVVFTPTIGGRYAIQMRVYDSKKDNAGNYLPCYCIVVTMVK